MSTPTSSDRGSEKLLERLQAEPLETRQFEELLKLLRSVNAELQDYFPLGRPAIELIEATVAVQAAAVAELVQGLVQTDSLQLRELRAHPRGIPPAEREVVVQFQVSGPARG